MAQRKWTGIWGPVRSLYPPQVGKGSSAGLARELLLVSIGDFPSLLCQGHSAAEVVGEGKRGRRWEERVTAPLALCSPSAHAWVRLCAGLAFICIGDFLSGSMFLSPRGPQMPPILPSWCLREQSFIQAKWIGRTSVPEMISTRREWGGRHEEGAGGKDRKRF